MKTSNFRVELYDERNLTQIVLNHLRRATKNHEIHQKTSNKSKTQDPIQPIQMKIFQSITYKKDLDKCRTNSRTYPFLWLILYILDVTKSTTPDI